MIYGFRARYLAVGRWANFCLDADPSASAKASYWAVETAATASIQESKMGAAPSPVTFQARDCGELAPGIYYPKAQLTARAAI